MYSENDFISKPSTTEQNISFNNKNEYINKVLLKEINRLNNKNKNLLTETNIKLKKAKQNKNPHHKNNGNSVNYTKFINSIAIKKESLIDKAQKSQRHLSANQGSKKEYKNALNKNNFSKKNDKLKPYFIDHSKTSTKIKINSQKMTQKIKAFKLKSNHSPSTQKSIATKNTTISTKKHFIPTNSKIGKTPPFQIFGIQNIMFNKINYNIIPQEYICISKISDNDNNHNNKRKHKNNNTDILGLKINTINSDKNKNVNHDYKKFKNKINNIKIDFFLDNKEYIDKLNKKEKSNKKGKSKKSEKAKSLNYITKI
jgi:hypothetical protein